MKILFLVPYTFIPPNKGNKQLIFNLLKYVTENAECDIVVLTDRSDTKSEVIRDIKAALPGLNNILLFDKPAGITRLLLRVKSMLRGYRPALGNYWNKSLAKWLSDSSGRRGYDLVHFDMFYMVQYRKYCRDVPSLLVPSDAYSYSAQLTRKAVTGMLDKIRMTIAYMLIVNHERREYKYFDMVCPVAQKDTDYLKGFLKQTDIRTVGIAISREFTDRKAREWEDTSKSSECKLLYIGPISLTGVADGLHSFLQKSFPQICAANSDARLVVLGPNPRPFLRNVFAENPRITHLDFVEDFPGFLDNDWIYIHPQQTNAGFQTKVQQAMAMGLPVVGFELAFTGMRFVNYQHCFMCKSFNEVTENILKLLTDASLRRKIGLAASGFIRDKYSVENVGAEVMKYYGTIVKQRKHL